MRRKFILSVIFLILSGGVGFANTDGIEWIHPNMFINQSEIEEIEYNINTGQEPWIGEYTKLIARADSVLTKGRYSVTFQGDSGNDYDSPDPQGGWKNCECARSKVNSNDINCSGNVICPGKINLKQERKDYAAMIKMGTSVQDLGLAYAFTGKDKYAKKAIELIYYWSVKPSTKMNPSPIYAYTEIRYPGTAMFYGADLIWNYNNGNWIYNDNGININVKDEFKKWTENIVDEVNKRDDLWSFPARVVFIGAGAIITENSTILKNVFEEWKSYMPQYIDTDGKNKIVFKIHPEATFSYSIFMLDTMTKGAEMARHYGVDLYTYSKDGKSLEKSLDFYVPYIVNSSSWPYRQDYPYTGIESESSNYEFAYSFFKGRSIDKSSYWSVIDKWGKTDYNIMYDNRNIGPITFTHRYRNSPPSIIIATSDNEQEMNWTVIVVSIGFVVTIFITYLMRLYRGQK